MRALLSALLLILPAPVVLAAERPADYARGLPLETPGEEPFYRVELPFEVHAGARADLRDVRVFNAAGEAVPMAIVPVRPLSPEHRPERQQVPFFPVPAGAGHRDADLDLTVAGADGRIISLRSRAPATTGAPVATAVLDLSHVASEVTGLDLEWPAPADNYSETVYVEASANLRDWRAVTEAAVVDMRYGGQHLQQRHVALPRGRYRYLRLRAGQRLPPLAGVRVVLPSARPAPVLGWREVAGVRGKDEGDVEFDLGAPLAVEQLSVRLPDANTVAPAVFEARLRRDEDWRPVANQTLYRIRQQERELASPALEPGLVTARYWRLRVDPRAGGLGATPPVLRAGWRPQQVVFVARGQGPWQLAWGRRSAPAAQLPLGTLLPGYRDGDENRLAAARTGTVVALSGRDVPPPGADDTAPRDWKRWLLWGVLLAGVAMLAAMAHSLLRPPRPKD
jgi:hypothetical protein